MSQSNAPLRDADQVEFRRWYRKVDAACLSLAGVGIDDLADGPSWDAWADGADPEEYAREQLAGEGFPFEE